MIKNVRKFFESAVLWLKEWWCVLIVLMTGALTYFCVSYIFLDNYYSELKDDYFKLQDDYVQIYNEEYDFYRQLLVVRDEDYFIEQKTGDGNYFYNTLSDDEKALYKMLYKVLREFWMGEREPVLESGKYCLASFCWEDYPSIKWDYLETKFALAYDKFSLFLGGGRFIDIDIKYLDYIEDESVLSLKRQYYYTVNVPSEYIELRKNKKMIEVAIEESVTKLSQNIDDNDDEFVKYVKIYEYVIDNTEYIRDYESKAVADLNTTTVIGVLDGKQNTGSNCQGYAAAMSYLCNFFDVDCLYVGSGKIQHAFNLVCIDGIWYYSDATNGDYGAINIECFLGGESQYWSLWNCDESYLFDELDFEVPAVSKTNYVIGENTYIGNLVID